MDKEDVVHTYIYMAERFSHKKKTNPTICNNMMELVGIMLSEISQAEKGKYKMISLTCGV